MNVYYLRNLEEKDEIAEVRANSLEEAIRIANQFYGGTWVEGWE